MTQHNTSEALCQSCGHDLVVQSEPRTFPGGGTYKHSDGYVYCSNEYCMHYTDPHPTTGKINGRRQAA